MRFHRPWFWLVAPVLGALAGLLYAIIFEIANLTGSAIRGALIGAPVLLYERGFLFPRWRDRIRQAATPIFVVATLATYAVMIVLGNAAAGTVLHHLFGYMSSARDAMMISESGFIYSLGVSAVICSCFACVT